MLARVEVRPKSSFMLANVEVRPEKSSFMREIGQKRQFYAGNWTKKAVLCLIPGHFRGTSVT